MTLDLRTATAEQLAEYVLGKVCVYAPSREEVAAMPSDLNLIAAAMPPGFGWAKYMLSGRNWYAWKKSQESSEVCTRDTGNEPLDRLRLAALAWEAQSKEKGQ